MKTYTMPKDTAPVLCYLSDHKGNAVTVFKDIQKDMKLISRKYKYNIDNLMLGDKYHAL
jgi:hypothetical protein